MNKDQIDDLIWGDFKSEIMEMEIPLCVSNQIMKDKAMDGVWNLFNGFLVFLMYKMDYKLKVHESFKTDFEDQSWWVKNLDEPALAGLSFTTDDSYETDPIAFQEFQNENEKTIKIGVLLNWFTFNECGLALKKSKLDNSSKYSYTEITNEFHLKSESVEEEDAIEPVLNYMKAIQNEEFTRSHTLVLRPDKLSDYIIALNEMKDFLEDFPDNVYTNEEWNKMNFIEKAGTYGKKELVFCTENNYKKLLEKDSIDIPNVNFITFYEFINDKLSSSINEWSNIRDRYISRLKNSIKEPHFSKDFSQSKKFLQRAKNSLEKNSYGESIMFSANAIEEALNVFLEKPELELGERIFAIKKHKELEKHILKLNFIRLARNNTVHATNFDPDENTARQALDMADEFLMDIQKTI